MNPSAISTYGSDLFLYYGGISRAGYDNLSTAIEAKEKKRDKVCLGLSTYGGDPDAAYRMARALRHHYESVEIVIPDICKSAGTLLTIGADRLVIGDRGELGPLDIQISKPDELFESMSGLDLIQALSALQNQVLYSFRTYLVDIRGGSRLRTKLAAEIAAKLSEDFIAPIAAKIDPVTLGEHQRAMQIGYDYGTRLSDMARSLKPGALEKLVSDYSSHGFVIDRKEASDLFTCVSHPDEFTSTFISWIRGIINRINMPEFPVVLDVEEHFKQQENQKEQENEKSHSSIEPTSDGDESDIISAAESTSGGVGGDDAKPDGEKPSSSKHTKKKG